MGRGAEKLLERMRASPHGWSEDDFRRLYQGFGFRCEEGGKHIFVAHPTRTDLLTTVPRHRNLAPVYARIAVGLIDQLHQEERNEKR